VARRKLTIPLTLAFAAAGAGVVGFGLVACGDDGESPPPEECTVEGMCPEDGRICLDEETQLEPCCPICPSDGTTCPNGCVLQFPPI
jgi:hypothetical protein